jgi:hypothetical protein
VRDAVVATPKGGKPPPPWWGRIDVNEAKLDKTKKPMLTGGFVSRAKDARPIVYIAAAKSPLPNWAREPLAMEDLALSGRLEIGPGVGVENVYGEGGAVEVGGRMRSAKGKTEGTLELGLGPLEVKVDLGPSGTSVKPGIGGGPSP